MHKYSCQQSSSTDAEQRTYCTHGWTFVCFTYLPCYLRLSNYELHVPSHSHLALDAAGHKPQLQDEIEASGTMPGGYTDGDDDESVYSQCVHHTLGQMQHTATLPEITYGWLDITMHSSKNGVTCSRRGKYSSGHRRTHAHKNPIKCCHL